jgi:hypothetical protein
MKEKGGEDRNIMQETELRKRGEKEDEKRNNERSR